MISLEMWSNLSRVAEFHARDGYQDSPQPWTASREAMEVTLPPGVRATSLTGGELLVGSAEQSFIEAMLVGMLPPGKWMTITPCFREEPQYDELHHLYFMKLELIHYMPPQFNSRHAVEDMLCQAQAGFEMLLGSAPDEARTQLVKTDIGYDLNLAGHEIGSYGFRRFEDHYWVYGTGLAEPRFTTLKMRLAGVPGV